MWHQKPDKIAEGFYMVGTAGNPAYLVRSETEWMLIESSILSNAGLILSQLKSIIPDISLLKHWFITHSHYDHCGTIEYIHNHLPWLKMYASKEAISNFSKKKFADKVRQLNGLLNHNTPLDDAKAPEVCLSELPFIQVNDLENIDIDQQDWLVVYTPGHSSCSLSLYSSSCKILFVSDALGEMMTPQSWFPLAFESMNSFIASIVRLQGYEADYVALGHHGVLSKSDARPATQYCLKSSYEVIDMIRKMRREEGVEYTQKKIIDMFRKYSAAFVPAKVYEKSIAQLMFVLENEGFL